MLAHSRDGGFTYQGNYGMFRPEEQWTIELTRYMAVDGAMVLMANWYEKDSGNEGASMFELKSLQKSITVTIAGWTQALQ